MNTTEEKKFNPQEFEPKWQGKWEEIGLFQDTIRSVNENFDTPSVSLVKKHNSSPKAQRHSQSEVVQNSIDSAAKKLYLLFAFAYPSGSGLHVGHVESKTALDIMARYYRMKGRDVFFPVGWDAFGLPAENYAIKTGVHPAETTKNAIDTFRRQIKRIGISYDWANELATCHPDYYKWTQWLFLKLYEKGLAYKKKAGVNWCPSCQTVLANEQVVEGNCERCGTEVMHKELVQWFFKITKYVEELITGLDKVDWPKATKEQQINWIGKSQGVTYTQKVKNLDITLQSYDSVPQTFMAQTFCVIAPEHPAVEELVKGTEHEESVKEFVKNFKKRKVQDRFKADKEIEGIFTGRYIENPFGTGDLPIWVSTFVIYEYGTGFVNCSAHDERDFAFAKKYNIPLRPVMFPQDPIEAEKVRNLEYCYHHAVDGVLTMPAEFEGRHWGEVRIDVVKHIEKKGFGKSTTQYKLRDWLISRQRYWGAPIPIVYDPDGKAHPVKQEHLPWLLPTDVEFKPTGQSPLTYSKEFIARTEKLYGKGWRPEFDTMDTFVDSSWYYLRYPMVSLSCSANENFDASSVSLVNQQSSSSKAQRHSQSEAAQNFIGSTLKNFDLPFDPKVIRAWLPVDFYMIGPEHIVLHLLYSRFFTKFLRDEGLLTFDEPFTKMRHQGMILGPDHKKMSKSKGNVIDPDKIIGEYGADTLRLYEMFLGPIEDEKPWNTESVIGPYKFLKKIYDLFQENSKFQIPNAKLVRQAHHPEQSRRTNTKIQNNTKTSPELERELHKAIKCVGEDIVNLKFNTAIAALMELLNIWKKPGMTISAEDSISFLKILAPFAPFLAEELYQQCMNNELGIMNNESTEKTKSAIHNSRFMIHDSKFNSIHLERWPTYNPKLLVSDTVALVVQVNGRLRGNLNVAVKQSKDQSAIEGLARKEARISQWLQNGVKKVIFIPGRLINFVV